MNLLKTTLSLLLYSDHLWTEMYNSTKHNIAIYVGNIVI
jgi:hypothetical protein